MQDNNGRKIIEINSLDELRNFLNGTPENTLVRITLEDEASFGYSDRDEEEAEGSDGG